MSNIVTAVGIIAFIVIMGLMVAAYPAVFGSVHEDAGKSGVLNDTSKNESFKQGENVAQGFMGFTMAQVYVGIILLIIVCLLIVFSF